MIKSDSTLYCRKIHKLGELDVKEVVEEDNCIAGPADLFEENYDKRVSEATYIFTDSGEIIKDGEVVGYGSFSIGGVTFGYNDGEWVVEGQGYISGGMVFEGCLRFSGAWVDLLGDLTVKGSLFIDSESTLILQSVSWPGLIVKGMLKIDGYGRFNTGIYAGSMMIRNEGEVEIYSGLLVAHNLQNRGMIKVKFSHGVVKRVVERLIKENEGMLGGNVVTVQYADSVTDLPGVVIPLFSKSKVSLKEIISSQGEGFSGSVTQFSYRIIGTDRSTGVDLGGGVLPPIVDGIRFASELKKRGYQNPVLVRIIFVPPMIFYGEYFDTVSGEIGIYRLGDGYRKVDKEYLEAVAEEIKESQYSLPETLAEEAQQLRDWEWDYYLSNEPTEVTATSFSPSSMLSGRGSFEPMGTKVIKRSYYVKGFRYNTILYSELKERLAKNLLHAYCGWRDEPACTKLEEDWDVPQDVINYDRKWNDGKWIGCSPVAGAGIIHYWEWRDMIEGLDCGTISEKYYTWLLSKMHDDMETGKAGECFVDVMDEGETCPFNIGLGIKRFYVRMGLEVMAYDEMYTLLSPFEELYENIKNNYPVLHSYSSASEFWKDGHTAIAYGLHTVVVKKTVWGKTIYAHAKHYVFLVYMPANNIDDSWGVQRIDWWATSARWVESIVHPYDHLCDYPHSGGGGSGGGISCSESDNESYLFLLVILIGGYLVAKRIFVPGKSNA